MNLPIRCMASGCGHRFERTAAEVLADGRCPRCASTDIVVDEGGLEVSAALPAEPAAIAMEPASEVNQETARCAFCMKTFAYRSADPTEPVPACPHCGATATTPAGAAGMHTASILRTASKIEEIARSVLSTNPGMTPREAVTIANETVRRYPKVVG